MADNQRAHMEQVHREGGSVYHKGRIIPPGSPLPSELELAKGDADLEAAARRSLEAKRDAINAELQSLDAPSTGTSPAPSAARTGVDADELPEDFPGYTALTEAGYSKVSQVDELSEEELTEISGIGPATAAKIIEARK